MLICFKTSLCCSELGLEAWIYPYNILIFLIEFLFFTTGAQKFAIFPKFLNSFKVLIILMQMFGTYAKFHGFVYRKILSRPIKKDPKFMAEDHQKQNPSYVNTVLPELDFDILCVLFSPPPPINNRQVGLEI